MPNARSALSMLEGEGFAGFEMWRESQQRFLTYQNLKKMRTLHEQSFCGGKRQDGQHLDSRSICRLFRAFADPNFV